VETFFPGFQAIHFVQPLLLCVELFAEIQFVEIHFDFCLPLILGWDHPLLLCVELFAGTQFVEIHFDFGLLFVLGLGYSLLLFGQMFAGIHCDLAKSSVGEP